MRAVGHQNPLPIDDSSALIDIELPKPTPAGRDLLVEVRRLDEPRRYQDAIRLYSRSRHKNPRLLTDLMENHPAHMTETEDDRHYYE
jgi:hypothetical protein